MIWVLRKNKVRSHVLLCVFIYSMKLMLHIPPYVLNTVQYFLPPHNLKIDWRIKTLNTFKSKWKIRAENFKISAKGTSFYRLLYFRWTSCSHIKCFYFVFSFTVQKLHNFCDKSSNFEFLYFWDRHLCAMWAIILASSFLFPSFQRVLLSNAYVTLALIICNFTP